MALAQMRFRFRGVSFSVATVLTVATSAAAQGRGARRPVDPATPSAPHERMTFFEGTWSMEPGGYFKSGAAPQTAHEETCAWLAGGRRHMVCRSWRAGADSTKRESIYILSYRDADSTYVSHFAFAGGANLVYYGRVEGDRWVMNLQPPPRWPANERLRTIITAVPGGGLRFVEEHSVDGGPWTITEDYRYRRVR
jgi:hypothetical protein